MYEIFYILTITRMVTVSNFKVVTYQINEVKNHVNEDYTQKRKNKSATYNY